MTPQARVQTTIELLDSTIASVQRNGAAADQIIADGFKSRRYAGSRDRRAIRDMIYQVIRAYGSAPVSGRAAVQGLGMEYAAFFDGSPYGPAALTHYDMPALAMPLPEWLSALIPPLEQQALLQRAPLDLRVNTLKTDIETALACFPGAKRIGQRGLRLADNRAIEQSDAWRDGWVDIQDYGSQYIAQVCVAQPGQTVVDLCAGAGGKALALAANMENQGRLIACDIDRARLARLRPRAHRLGAAMIESRLLFAPHEQENLADLHQKADVVLVDAPCSGTGTWRRNPEARWRLSPERLEKLIASQRNILSLGATLVRPGGSLIYAVCSLIEAEGEAQCLAFLLENQDWTSAPLTADIGRIQGPGLILSPAHDGCDGFFVARLMRRNDDSI